MKTYTTTITLLFILLCFSVSNAQTELISSNRDFNNGTLSPWFKSGDVLIAGSNFTNCYSCPGYAVLGVNTSGTAIDHASGSLYRTVTIPNNVLSGSNATFVFYANISTAETNNSVAYDKLDIFLNDINSYGYEINISNINRTSGYVKFEYTLQDIEDFAGKSMTLSFEVDCDGAKPTAFRVDDISLVIQTQNSCTYSLPSTSQHFPVNGGSGSFDVNTQSACPWNATTTYSWISTSSSGSGSGDVDYTVQANPDIISRTGTIKVEGKTFTITQDAAPLLKADLSLSNISITPNPVIQGASATITCYMWNKGLADAQNVSVSYMLSNDCSENTSNDYPLGTSTMVNISALGKYTMNFNVQIPVDALWEGTKYLKCWIDFSKSVVEASDDDNRSCIQILITQSPGQIFSLNPSKSHLMWPFYNQSDNSSINPNTKWDNQKNGIITDQWFYKNSHDTDTFGNVHHDNSSWFAQDWNYKTDECNYDFYSPLAGTVLYSSWGCIANSCTSKGGCTTSWGNTIVIRSTYDPSYIFRIAHLQNFARNFQSGDNINSGEKLGRIGNTGSSSNTHAHCQLNKVPTIEIDNVMKHGNFINSLQSYAVDFDFDAVFDVGGGGTGFYNSIGKQSSISVFPNPNQGHFNLQYVSAHKERGIGIVTNALGEVVSSLDLHFSTGKNENVVDISHLPDGIYVFSIMTKNQVETFKLVIQR